MRYFDILREVGARAEEAVEHLRVLREVRVEAEDVTDHRTYKET
jgi:hypothetical protein